MLAVQVNGRLGAFRIEATFETGPAQVTALFGRSGAGKTTLVNMIAGLVKPEAGRIAVNGEPLFDSARAIDLPANRRRVGYVFQDSRLFPHLTVRANLVYGMKLTPPAQRHLTLEQVVDLLGLGPLIARRPATLSGGERRRVAIGRALLTSPRLLLMDEPLSGLDAARKNEILPFIEGLRRELKLPIVYVSHNLDEVLRVADRIALMVAGRVVAFGPIEEVAARPEIQRMTGRDDPVTILAATVARHEPAFALTHLAFAAGALRVPRLDLAPGTEVRVRLHARDISLARARPTDISVLNLLAGTVAAVDERDDGTVDVAVDLGAGISLRARVTLRARHDLGLEPGLAVHALIKSVAIDRFGPGRWDQSAAADDSGSGT